MATPIGQEMKPSIRRDQAIQAERSSRAQEDRARLPALRLETTQTDLITHPSAPAISAKF